MEQEFKTEIDFLLPRGYLDESGTLHREGSMRMATAKDEIHAQGNPYGAHNDAKIVVRLLARVITKLSTVTVDETIIENLFTIDYAYLQEIYTRLNGSGQTAIQITCPECNHQFTEELTLGEV